MLNEQQVNYKWKRPHSELSIDTQIMRSPGTVPTMQLIDAISLVVNDVDIMVPSPNFKMKKSSHSC